MATQLTNTALEVGQQFTISVIKTDGHGNGVPFSGVPLWSSADETVMTVIADQSGLNASVMAVAPGSANLTVTGDSLTGIWGVTVTGPKIMFLASPAMSDGA